MERYNMKEFEKWKQNNCDENCDIGTDTGVCKRCSGLGTKEDAWKAALKMVMIHEGRRYGNDFMTDEPMNVLYNFIRKELEDE